MLDAHIGPKCKRRMLKRVTKIWPSKMRGVSFASFKNLYHTMEGMEHFERAFTFLDGGNGINYDDLRHVCHQ